MKPKKSQPSRLIQKVNQLRNSVFDKIVRKNPGSLWRCASLKDVRKVVIVCAASRSGSSLLYALLKKMPSFYALSGESVPFLKCNGFTGDAFLSDEIPSEAAGGKEPLLGLSRDFLSDFSVADAAADILDDKKRLESYIDDVALRFVLQWPGVSFSYEGLKGSAAEAATSLRKAGRGFNKEDFALELIRFLRREHKAVNPYYYDISVQKVKKKFRSLRLPSGPPNDSLTIEEPPFILLSPAKKAAPADLAKKTLLLKSSADCYRMPFVEKLLPNADIKIIHLARNPAASINGLCDGWRHRGFFSRNVEAFSKLRILGYSDRFEWGKRWWNYDLPPGWQDYVERPLEEVCAFQWHSANTAIQEYLSRAKKSYCPVRYENIIGNLGSRIKVLGQVAEFAGIKDDPLSCCGLERLPLIQATEAPRRYRWKKRLGVLAPILNRPQMKQMSASLGYHNDRMEEWL